MPMERTSRFFLLQWALRVERLMFTKIRTECGAISKFVSEPQTDDWEYFNLNPGIKYELLPREDNQYEVVIVVRVGVDYFVNHTLTSLSSIKRDSTKSQCATPSGGGSLPMRLEISLFHILTNPTFTRSLGGIRT